MSRVWIPEGAPSCLGSKDRASLKECKIVSTKSSQTFERVPRAEGEQEITAFLDARVHGEPEATWLLWRRRFEGNDNDLGRGHTGASLAQRFWDSDTDNVIF